MLSDMGGFLPVGRAFDGAVDGTQRADAQQPLIREKRHDENKHLAPAPLLPMRLEKFVQARHIQEDIEDETVERGEGEHSEPERKLDEEEHENGYWHENGEEGLHLRQHQYIE